MLFNLLKQKTQEINITLSTAQVEKFIVYLDLLKKYSEKINITNIREDKDIISKHFIDSLSCVYATGSLNNEKVIDVGCGAGFPGVPLKIYFENLHLTLLDSKRKCVDFLKILIDKLELKNVEIIKARAEDAGRDKKYRNVFDICLSRAVAKLPVAVEYCLPFLKIGGICILQKGKINEELKISHSAISKLGGKIENIIPVPELEGKKNLFVIKKIISTPDIFPRKAGIPEKRPIITEIFH